MFHTEAGWKSDDGIDVFRAISGSPTLQRFSLVEIVSSAPTYQVDLVFLDQEGEQCWRKFFCAEISKLAHMILGENISAARISVISVGRYKKIEVGERIMEIFEAPKGVNSSFFFCETTTGILLSDEIFEISATVCGTATSIWKSC
jgi:hypothetical protein